MPGRIKSDPESINVGMIVPCTEAEGPGKRFALWVQGCPMRCAGCCNPELLEFEDKTWTSIDDLLAQILEAREKDQIEGVTFLGGEPFAQPQALGALAERVRQHGLTVMIFSGYTLKGLRRMKRPGVARLLAATDLLVDGQFDQDQIDKERRWIGSVNQQTHDLSGAYQELVQDWDRSPETLEIRVVNGKLLVNGSPFLLNEFNKL
jgi:anaerobic ribonucleoside-triphosphate reductase activating protein